MMTREEMRELLSAANVILASARSRTKPGKLRVAIGDAQDYIYRARRALKAEKPLAEGWLYAISRTIPKGTIYGATFSAYNPDWADQQRIIILEEAAR